MKKRQSRSRFNTGPAAHQLPADVVLTPRSLQGDLAVEDLRVRTLRVNPKDGSTAALVVSAAPSNSISLIPDYMTEWLNSAGIARLQVTGAGGLISSLPIKFQESADPTVAVYQTGLYAKDKTGFASLYFKDGNGVVHDLSLVTSSAPNSLDYLVGTASGDLSAEIVAGTAPGGELGGTWASPTVDATHSGSAHHVEDHDHDGSPTQQLLAANTHGTPSADTHHAKAHDHTTGDSSGVLTNDEHDGYIEGVEIAEPSAPAANKGRLFFVDDGAGKTSFRVRFPTGATQVIASEP
jgi:hypothetical protein